MSKRKQTDEEDVGDDDSDVEPTPDVIDVHFDYYNVNASNDYHAIHRLFIQLFGPDAKQVNTGALTDLVTRVAEESGVGSTIKTEEEEGTDPYAVLTVISCREHPDVQTVTDYVLSKTSGEEGFHDTLSSLLRDRTEWHVGLVLSERLINMPVQVMGPMYRMLLEEIEEAVQEGQAYRFTHYLFISRVYRLSAEEEDAQRHSKRYRCAPTKRTDGAYGFHPEDDEIMQHATHTASYTFTPQDAERVGLDVAGRAMLVPAAQFAALVQAIRATYVM